MIIVALENVRSVFNVGSIFRTMEGLGFSDVALVGITPTPLTKYGNKRSDFAKTALGAEEMLRWKYFDTILDVVAAYPSAQVVSIEKVVGAKDIALLAPDAECASGDTIVVFGNEVDGVSKEALSLSSAVYEIPMKGTKESFNVAISASICLYLLQAFASNT